MFRFTIREVLWLTALMAAGEVRAQEPVIIPYPKRVGIPDDLPSVALVLKEKPGDERYVVLPPVLYLTGHYRGWQQCLDTCGLKPISETAGPAYSTNEPYTNLGERRGYNDCVKALRDLLKSGVSEVELARRCKASHRPFASDLAPAPKKPTAP